MNEEIATEVKKAQRAIREAIQVFQDTTGLTVHSVDLIDVRNCGRPLMAPLVRMTFNDDCVAGENPEPV